MSEAPELIRRHFDKDVRGGMPCPKCSAPSRVLDSRPDAGGKIRRRRMCVTRTCLHRFTTQEVVVDRQLPLVFGDLFEAVSKRLLKTQIELTDIQDAINSAQKLAAMMKERA